MRRPLPPPVGLDLTALHSQPLSPPATDAAAHRHTCRLAASSLSTRLQTRSWLIRGVLACGLLVSVAKPTPVAAAVIATDANVPATMNVTGTSGDYAQYVIGNTAGFTRTFTQSVIDVGNFSGANSATPNYIQLLIQNGGTAAFTSGLASFGNVAPFTTTTVTGSGSQLLLNSGASQEFVFFRNTGVGDRVLEVVAGGFADLRELETQVAGTLTIDGSGSTVYVEDTLVFSNTPTLDVSITGGGLWNLSSFGTDAATIDVTIDGSSTMRVRGALDLGRFNSLSLATGGTLQVDGALTNGTISSGTIDLTSGGSIGSGVTLNGGDISTAAFSAANLTFTSGTLTATGAVTDLNTLGAGASVILDGGSWAPTGSINAGNLTIQNGGSATVPAGFDGTNLTFTNGSLTVSGDVSNLPTIGSGQQVTLSGGGALLTSTTLNGGTLIGNNFDLADKLTFTSGTLTVSGTLQNLTALPAGTTVNMSGASADLLLSNTLTITGGTINVTNGASITVLDNVSLGAGSITFAAAGGSIALSGGVFNVASMDTPLALNANASLTGYGTMYGGVNLGTSGDAGAITGDAGNGGMTIFGDVSGTGSISNTTIYGNVSVGNSPGSITLTDVDLGNTNITMEIEGTADGQYDTLIFNSGTDPSSANLTIGFASSFTPSTADSWQLMSGGGDYTGFNTISTPDGWSLTSTGMLVAVVPEPASLLLALSGLTLAGGYLRRTRRLAASADQREKTVPPAS